MHAYLYTPGHTWLHRLGPASKLLGLMLLAAVSFLTARVDWLALLLAGTLVGLKLARLALLRLLRGLVPALLVLAVLTLLNWWLIGADHAAAVGLRLSTLLVAASAVTATTSSSAMLAAIERALMPLERAGLLHAQKVAFTLTLAVTLIPVMITQLRTAREAQWARGMTTSVRALTTPLLVRVLRTAEELAEAVEARGFPRRSVGEGIAQEDDRR